MLNPNHLRELIIRPVLIELGQDSDDFEHLMMECAFIDTGITHLHAHEHVRNPHGIGLWGLSVAEYVTLWDWAMQKSPKRSAYRAQARLYVPYMDARPDPSHLVGNLRFAAFCAAVLWMWLVPPAERWPSLIPGRYECWKQYWCQGFELFKLGRYRKLVEHLHRVETGIAVPWTRGNKAQRSWEIEGRYAPKAVRLIMLP